MARKIARNEFHSKLLKYDEENIGNQLPCLKEEMWKQVCEAWYSVALNVLEELNNSMSRRIVDLIKQMEVQRILTLRCRRTGM